VEYLDCGESCMYIGTHYTRRKLQYWFHNDENSVWCIANIMEQSDQIWHVCVSLNTHGSGRNMLGNTDYGCV